MNELFKLVFNNMVLFKIIFKYVRLYRKNECATFKNRELLLQYTEREYLTKIIYKSKQMLKNGDLPVGGVLKEIEFVKVGLSSIKGEAIPYGVEIISYCTNFNNQSTTPFSKLPSTIHTINNAVVTTSTENQIIPPNITSISFTNSPKLSKSHFIIPNTVKSLIFKNRKCYYINGNSPLGIGDIPNGLTKLSIQKRTEPFQDKVIPTSITDLSISSRFFNSTGSPFKLDASLKLIKTLTIYCHFNSNITPESNLLLLKHLTKLNIHLYKNSIIYENSIPNSVTELELHKCFSYSENIQDPKVGLIPNSITKLTLSLNNFEYIQKLIPILPPSLTHLKLPSNMSNMNLNLPFTIKNIIY